MAFTVPAKITSACDACTSSTPAAVPVGLVNELASAPCSLTSSFPGFPTAPSRINCCLGAATGRLIVVLRTGRRRAVDANGFTGTPTVNRSEDETFALVTIVVPSRTTCPAWAATSPAVEKNPGSVPLPSFDCRGLLTEIVDSLRDRSTRKRWVTFCPGNSVNDSGFVSGVPVVPTAAWAPVYTPQLMGLRVTDCGVSANLRKILPVASSISASVGAAPSPATLSMVMFHRSPGCEARSCTEAPLPSLSTMDKLARNVPGTMPSLVPTSIGGMVGLFGSKLGMNVSLPR